MDSMIGKLGATALYALLLSACAAEGPMTNDQPAVAEAQRLGHGDVRDMDAAPALLTESYGPAPAQIGELRLPDGEGPFPVAVVIHGGCWTKAIGASQVYMRPLAAALAERGIATWNISYRQMGDAGAGWPGTFLDWGAGVDHLRALAGRYPLDLDRVGVIGHSAGAHAALFVASRPGLPEASAIRGGHPLPIQSIVAIDGPGDLALGRQAAVDICGVDGIEAVMGGTPEAVPDRYAEGSPAARLPLGAEQLVIASVIMPPDQGAAYRDRAAAAGDDVRLITLEGAGHFNMIAPGTEAWGEVADAYARTLGGE